MHGEQDAWQAAKLPDKARLDSHPCVPITHSHMRNIAQALRLT